MARHEQLFHAVSLLHAALPRDFPEPDAVEVVVEVSARDQEARVVLGEPLTEAFVVRLLAQGMPDGAVLLRLFGDACRDGPFPEAASIAWTVASEPLPENTLQVRVIGSGYWLDALRETRSYTATL
jgi:hypothetical protein